MTTRYAPPGDIQAEPCSLANGLRREERLEDAVLDPPRYSGPVVGDSTSTQPPSREILAFRRPTPPSRTSDRQPNTLCSGKSFDACSRNSTPVIRDIL